MKKCALIAVLITILAMPAWAVEAPPAEAKKTDGDAVAIDITTVTKTSSGGTLLSPSTSVLSGGLNAVADAAADVIDPAKMIAELGGRTTSKGEVIVPLGTDALFEKGKMKLAPDAVKNLEKIADLIALKSPKSVKIEGHTDDKGKDDKNVKTSEKQAEAVKKWLVEEAFLPGEMMTTKGFGKQNPIAPNSFSDGKDNPDGRAQNRRVEVTLEM